MTPAFIRRHTSRLGPRWTWGLAVTLALSAWARWWPAPAPAVSPVREPLNARGGFAIDQIGSGRMPRLPEGVSLSPALGDPFAPMQRPVAASAPAPDLAPATPAAVAPTVAAAVPLAAAPAPPDPGFRYLGQMTDPQGQQWLYLGRGEQSIAVSVGAELEGGFKVQAIGPQGIELRHVGQGLTVVIPVPTANEGAGS